MGKLHVGGIYRHFKGNFYRVISIARHSETRENVVVYKPLLGCVTYVRPLSMFMSNVDSSKYPKAIQRARFQYCRCSYEEYMDILYNSLSESDLNKYKIGEQINYKYLECDEPSYYLKQEYHINDKEFAEFSKFATNYKDSWLRTPYNPLSLYRTSLSIRVIDCLKRRNINTLYDLLDTELDKIAEFKGIGSSALREVKQVIELYQDDANITLERKLHNKE